MRADRRTLRSVLANLVAPVLAALVLAACAGPGDRGRLAGALAADAGLRTTDGPAAGRLLRTAFRPGAPGRAGSTTLVVVFEGDGAGHDARGRATADPTPTDPVGLRIAAAWPRREDAVAWVARPCQYVRDTRCGAEDWTVARFSPDAVAAADAAVDRLVAEAGAGRTILAGWSGGGALAVLVAARRTDVAAVLTMAAPLDLAAWTAHHRATPLRLSTDPATVLPSIAPIAQIHAAAAGDRTVPPAIVLGAAARAGAPSLVVPGDHACCWTDALPDLVRRLERGGGGP